MDLLIQKFGDRLICLKGVGKLFYQDGFPISISISELKKKGIEVSILHVADECLKNGWSAKTTFNNLKTDMEEDIDRNAYDISLLKSFCYADYERQREMIFEYLFNNSKEEAMKFMREKLLP